MTPPNIVPTIKGLLASERKLEAEIERLRDDIAVRDHLIADLTEGRQRLRAAIAITATYLANQEYRLALKELNSALQPRKGEK